MRIADDLADGHARIQRSEGISSRISHAAELLALGYRIPDDASVVGFGDFSTATQISPQLTTVRVEGAEMGAVALRLLLERIEAGRSDAPARRILVAQRIVERRSAGPLRAPIARETADPNLSGAVQARRRKRRAPSPRRRVTAD